MTEPNITDREEMLDYLVERAGEHGDTPVEELELEQLLDHFGAIRVLNRVAGKEGMEKYSERYGDYNERHADLDIRSVGAVNEWAGETD
jgi:hypothetical protein